ncbi:pimeloyl-ACP methyl ester carboxylesterase [Streptosporangium becharense]|uniref:Pimeloyl-ACP methyl ester carboxylesterase n=1 Tax=Streptosporangium becharense TaxID=1816182 RepID=A0A7W9IDW7_9ACTN|nr:alpha/beta hydrolase [Streptosporangium becharense]MBB2912350.1 pimeloyl-ACP methyl ester carboxylesterase [Streptosporangium becharense]MBB5818897.1 pimeloyl-ACP methyl ester carboxylesterase [Streptosporangium becharense]
MKRVVGAAAGVGLLVAAVGVPQGAVAQERTGLVWGACRGTGRPVSQGTAPDPARRTDDTMECATLRVPLDYRNPHQTIGIALSRVRGKAPRDGDHLGSLLVNPGGPGASGLDLAKTVASTLPAEVADRLDVIGFDPRGVGDSEPALTCVDPKTYYAPPRLDHVPDSRRDEAALLSRARRYAEACGGRWSWMLPHLGTENSARDMDQIRAALGESKISYLGYSYGTYLGAVYATLFPDRVGRLVLDSVVDPRGVWYAANLTQNVAFDRRHQDFLKWTARHNVAYRLGETGREVSFAWYAMRERLERRPAGGVVGPSELDDIYTVGGYNDVVWPQLAKAFSAYVKKGETAPLVAAYRRHAENDAKDENSYAVYLGVQCRDAAWPRDWSRWRADMTRLHARAPFLTWPNAWYNAPCAFWPEQGGTPVRIRPGAQLPPALLIQSERDAATPYTGALHMRGLLPGSRLLAVPGGNHGVALGGNRCVDRRLAAYLKDGTLPPPAPGRHEPGDPDARCSGSPAPVPALRLGARTDASR